MPKGETVKVELELREIRILCLAIADANYFGGSPTRKAIRAKLHAALKEGTLDG